MGNFSRPPEQRLGDATSKHYVGVRVEQGVPLLDADLHLLDGLHRHELEQVGQWMLGNGVPVGSDAFRVLALAGGGMNTIVVKSKTSINPALSSLEIDPASTAAAVLGFGPENASARRFGDSPALLTGTTTQSFALVAGATLIVRADGGPPETITFQPGPGFVNIAAATAAEVVAAINTASTISAAVGEGNDFFLRGGDGTVSGAGRLLVDGRMALIERGLRYREQPLYKNTVLAGAWGVDVVDDIPTPMVNETQQVFVDVWHREVDRAEDAAIIDIRIDIQTAVTMRREWAVRVVAKSAYDAAFAARPTGHSYYPLAELNRSANSKAISEAMVLDVRATDNSLRPEIAYRDTSGAIAVDTDRFRDMLVLTRDNCRAFITFLTTKFVPSTSTYVTAEIVGLETLSAVANLADQALVTVNARALGTQGALAVMKQLYDAESRFVAVWQSTVLPLVKNGTQLYAAAFGDSLTSIKKYLDGPAPAGTAIAAALSLANLDGAVTSQERIAGEIGTEAGKPVGVLLLKYLGSPSSKIIGNTPFDLKFEVSGSVTPADDLDPVVFVDSAWKYTFKNDDGSTPFALTGGPGNFTRQFIITVTPPLSGQALLSVEVHSRKNSGGLFFLSTQKLLKVGDSPPPSEQQYEIRINNTVLVPVAGEFPIVTGDTKTITFRFENHTGTPISIDWENSAATGAWTVTQGTLPANPVNPSDGVNLTYGFKAPPSAGVHLTFTLTAKDHTDATIVRAAMTVTLVSKAP